MDKKIREIKRDSHMVDGSQGQVAKVAALPSGPHCLHCHGDDDDDIPDICHFFTLAKFLENKIYTEKRQFFAHFMA